MDSESKAVFTGVPPSIDGYLKFVGLPASPKPAPTMDTLKYLQSEQQLRMTFNNLYLHRGARIAPSIDMNKLYEKTIVRGHGGFCYELNGILGWALQQLGFDVEYRSASVNLTAVVNQGPWTAQIHMFLLVTVDGVVYYVDAGFALSAPMPLVYDEKRLYVEQTLCDGYVYRFGRSDDGVWYYLERRAPDGVTFVPRLRWLVVGGTGLAGTAGRKLIFPTDFEPGLLDVNTNTANLFHKDLLVMRYRAESRDATTKLVNRLASVTIAGYRKIITQHPFGSRVDTNLVEPISAAAEHARQQAWIDEIKREFQIDGITIAANKDDPNDTGLRFVGAPAPGPNSSW